MLKYLYIENVAVIENANIEFQSGFNVLTGETGAGKSIIIDSINVVLGERTSKELIRAGCDWAEVNALFGEISSQNLRFLEEYGIFPDEDGNISISRRISNSGKGFIKINGKPFTVTLLKEISANLINIHGQHDNQALLNPDKHCDFIDAVADNSNFLDEYYDEFKNVNKIRRELEKIDIDEDEKQRKSDLLKYQINELETAEIKIGEVEKLKSNLKIAENYEQSKKAIDTVNSLLNGSEDSNGAITLLESAVKQISNLKSDEFEKNYHKLNEILDILRDISDEFLDFADNFDFENLNSDKINNRLDYLHKLMLKYGNTESEMLEFLDNAKVELSNISYTDKRYNELSDLLDAATEKLISLGENLSDSRKKAATDFAAEVCEILRYLNMPMVKFTAQIEKGRYTKRGCDNIEFLISANQGEALKPLQKIASGGELSRIMLAIKSSLLGKDNIDTVIFDEIDTGISGFAAEKVANQLKKVSLNSQIICVTHLAQIAAKADNHFLIEKKTENGRTYTNVYPLNYEDRINEIARIMSGTEMTENLYNSAKELLDRRFNDDNL